MEEVLARRGKVVITRAAKSQPLILDFPPPLMKRDLVLARKVLEFVETRGSRLFKGSVAVEGYERDEVIHHLYLLVSGGFIELGQETLANRGPLVLTWKGCDYLDQLRAKDQPRRA